MQVKELSCISCISCFIIFFVVPSLCKPHHDLKEMDGDLPQRLTPWGGGESVKIDIPKRA